jgi:serine/threonine protein kinase
MIFTKKLYGPPSPFPINPIMERQGAAMKFQYGNGQSPLEGYVIRRGIGIGGFGEVYFAESDSGKEVALKRIQKNLDVEIRGVRHCLNLRHPNLVAIYDIRYDHEQQGWIVMEFIEGESLRDHLDRSTDPLAGPIHSFEQGKPERILPVFAQIIAGMTYLHDQGIVHRDLKPANIFLDKGLAKIGDYGLSKYISTSRRAGQTESVGTFHYMAPEIGKGEYGKEIDIYSLGIILYEMLTGTVPFDGQSTQEILLKHLTADPDLSMLPEGLAHVIGKSLAKNPTNRYRDGRELLHDLGFELTAAGFVSPLLASRPAIGQPTPDNASTINRERTSQADAQQAKAKKAIPTTSEPLSPMQRIQAFFTIGIDGHREMLQREPIFLQVRGGLESSKSWFGVSSNKDSSNSIAALVAIAVILAISGAAAVLGSILGAYAIYYSLWFFGHITADDLRKAPSIKDSRTIASPLAMQETVGYPTATIRPGTAGNANRSSKPISSKPLSNKEAKRIWRAEQQQTLAQRDFWNSTHSWMQSLTFSGLIAAVTSIAGGFVAVSNGYLTSANGIWNSQALGAIAWLSLMSILCSWTVVSFARRWESKQEDSIAFRFAMMVSGLILGAISFQLSEFLLIPWNSILNASSSFQTPWLNKDFNRSLKGFYDADRLPNLAGHMAFFAGLMWIVRWWRQSDALRKKKFSMWAIVWSMLMAGLVQAVFYFPSPWCLWMAGTTSLAVQIASPWIDPSQPQLARKVSQGKDAHA